MNRILSISSVLSAGAIFMLLCSCAGRNARPDAVSAAAEPSATSQAASTCDLVAVMGGEPEQMFARAMAEMGGMERFVKQGDKVVVKPNIGWDRSPELAGNANPQLVAAVVRACLEAGASQVVVFDHTCDDWRKCYKNSGIEQAARDAGAKVVPADEERYYREVELEKAKNLKKTKIHQEILDCDVWFNIPILKNHGGAKVTCSMKNLMGIVWDRRYFHENNLDQCIADICTFEKMPALNIVDAYRVMKSNGPRGVSAADVVMPKALFVSTDILAVDAAAIRFFNQITRMPLEEVGYVWMAEQQQVGTMEMDSMSVRKIML